MSLSEEIIANTLHRLEQMAPEIDKDPDISVVHVYAVIDRRKRRVREVKVDYEKWFEPVPPGVVLRRRLDTALG